MTRAPRRPGRRYPAPWSSVAAAVVLAAAVPLLVTDAGPRPAPGRPAGADPGPVSTDPAAPRPVVIPSRVARQGDGTGGTARAAPLTPRRRTDRVEPVAPARSRR